MTITGKGHGQRPRARKTPDRGTPRSDRPTHDPARPLYAICGDDPRETASETVGQKPVQEIVRRLSEKVEDALALSSK